MKDTADDGPEVYIIRFFKAFPEGGHYAAIPRLAIQANRNREQLAPRKS